MSIPTDEQFRRGWEAMQREHFAKREAWVDQYRPIFEKITADAVADERERCAYLCDALAERHEAKATELRTPERGLVFKSVSPYNAKLASYFETSASSLRTIASLIRDGLSDARELKPTKPTMTESPADLVVGPMVETRAADGPPNWMPCSKCTDPMDCGSWATCMNSGESWPS